ncbi:MAG: hypothetical protein DRQ54_10450 [Gammaproteobacteria bacterium]|nr:MAG: hypothetical protein DRQ54_10450 [Gammaproteobacteria bacterium]
MVCKQTGEPCKEIKKYKQLKRLLEKEEISEALLLKASGIDKVSLSIKGDIDKADGLTNDLSTFTGLSRIALVSAISEKEHEKQIISRIRGRKALEGLKRGSWP